MVPDRESGADDFRLSSLINLRRRWSGTGSIDSERIVALDVAGPDPGGDRNPAPDNMPGRSSSRPMEPLPFSRRSGDSVEASKTTAKPISTGSRPGQDEGDRREWCAIVFASMKRQGEFRVIVLDNQGTRHVVARSSSFRLSRSGRVKHRGGAKRAHTLLVSRLLSSGWQPAASRGKWYDTAFTRTVVPDHQSVERLVITYRAGHVGSRFQAAGFDELGDMTIVAESRVFLTLRRGGSVRRTRRAIKAHQALLEQLQSDRWQKTEIAGLAWHDDVLAKLPGLHPVPA